MDFLAVDFVVRLKFGTQKLHYMLTGKKEQEKNFSKLLILCPMRLMRKLKKKDMTRVSWQRFFY